MSNNQIKQIASTTARLLSHTDRIGEIKHTHRIRPITIHLAPTNKCNLTCEWCSVKHRDKSQELSITDIDKILILYQQLGLKSVEITGGGDPTMHPDINDIIWLIKNHGLGVGLITNGLKLGNIETEMLKELDWLRISLSGVDFDLDSQYYDLEPLLPFFPYYTGCSYVFTDKSIQADRMRRVNDIATYLESNYLRIVPNCYTSSTIEWTRAVAPEHIKKFPQMFLQIKDYSVPPTCYWRYIKPFINADGYVYHCSTCALFAGGFTEPWQVCHWKEVLSLYFQNVPVTAFDSSGCTLCFYSQQNRLLQDLLVEVQNPRFL